jgi:diaminohydroxyphosphoribosylaminopyrimidine deaminase/5-amino-6-(5-phosphoribosylamino)uracil reductase
LVTWKFATTLDGRSAATDGSSRWVSSAAARRDTHVLRSLCDTMLVGSNTVAADDPHLTVRAPDDSLLPVQPLRVIMGKRDLPADRRIFDDAAETLQLFTHDPLEALRSLYDDYDRHHVFFEGGPKLAAVFLKAGLVDEIVTYVAPTLLGSGKSAVGTLGIRSIDQALRFDLVDSLVLMPESGDPVDELINLRLTLHPRAIMKEK